MGETTVAVKVKDAPRRWFRLLRNAEHLRTGNRDGAEPVRVRRELKELNPAMFGRYMERLGG
jgi:hypothetical protein